MADAIDKQAATDGESRPATGSGLTLNEIENRGLWSIQANRERELSAVARAALGEPLQPGVMLVREPLRLIQLWPHKLLLLSDRASLPAALQTYAALITDVGHGSCELGLRGANALNFLNSYSSVDLSAAQVQQQRNLRCLLGQYRLLLWWDDVDDIRLLVDRSYAQSLREYLEQLMQRWDWRTL